MWPNKKLLLTRRACTMLKALKMKCSINTIMALFLCWVTVLPLMVCFAFCCFPLFLPPFILNFEYIHITNTIRTYIHNPRVVEFDRVEGIYCQSPGVCIFVCKKSLSCFYNFYTLSYSAASRRPQLNIPTNIMCHAQKKCPTTKTWCVSTFCSQARREDSLAFRALSAGSGCVL